MSSFVLPPERASSLASHACVAGLWLDLQTAPPTLFPSPDTPRSSTGSSNSASSEASTLVGEAEEVHSDSSLKKKSFRPLPILPTPPPPPPAVAVVAAAAAAAPPAPGKAPAKPPVKPVQLVSSSIVRPSKPRALPAVPFSAPSSSVSTSPNTMRHPLPSPPLHRRAITTQSASVPSTPNSRTTAFGESSSSKPNLFRQYSSGSSSSLSSGSSSSSRGGRSEGCTAIPSYAVAEIAEELAKLVSHAVTAVPGRPRPRPEQPRSRPPPKIKQGGTKIPATPSTTITVTDDDGCRVPALAVSGSSHCLVPAPQGSDEDDDHSSGDDGYDSYSEVDGDDEDEEDLDIEDLENFSVQVVRGVAYRTADIKRVSRVWHGNWVLQRGGKQWDSKDYFTVMNALRTL